MIYYSIYVQPIRSISNYPQFEGVLYFGPVDHRPIRGPTGRGIAVQQPLITATVGRRHCHNPELYVHVCIIGRILLFHYSDMRFAPRRIGWDLSAVRIRFDAHHVSKCQMNIRLRHMEIRSVWISNLDSRVLLDISYPLVCFALEKGVTLPRVVAGTRRDLYRVACLTVEEYCPIASPSLVSYPIRCPFRSWATHSISNGHWRTVSLTGMNRFQKQFDDRLFRFAI